MVYAAEAAPAWETAKTKERAGSPNTAKPDTPAFLDKSLLDLTGEQRERAAFWKRVILDWRQVIGEAGKEKTVKTAAYVADFNAAHAGIKLTERTLRRKWELYRAHGEVALADFRGRTRETGRDIHEVAYSVFMQWWLDEAEPTVTAVHRLTEDFAKLRMPELLPLPSASTFRRAVKELPEPIIKFFRKGQKAFEDDCMPFIIRTYQGFDSNEIWSADYHTLDFFVRDDISGKVYRPHLIAWIDVRSRRVLSVTLMETSNSDGTVIGFRKAVKRFGVPWAVYLDNGNEFLVRDFGGKGRRRSDANAQYGMTILERLGVAMHNAKVRNAKAKVIERVFRDITFDFSKFVKTYTGGNPGDRPERLTQLLKNEKNIPPLSQVREWLEVYIEGHYNQRPSQGEGMDGQSPHDCYNRCLTTVRRARPEDLELMLLRSERLQTITANGVYVRISGEKIWFTNDVYVSLNLGKKVFVRYAPEDLSSVSLYDEQEIKVTDAELALTAGYDFKGEATKEAIKKLNSSRKKRRNSVLGFMDSLTGVHTAPAAMDILYEAGLMRMEQAAPDLSAAVIEPVLMPPGVPRESGAQSLLKASGSDEVVVDLGRMVENARKRKEL